MRITSGAFRGRTILVPKGKAVRPTSEKLRASIFDILGQNKVSGAHALDAFCGSGALGIEALSRGAQSCIFIDKAKPSIALTSANITNMELGAYTKVIKASALRPPKRQNLFPKSTLAFFDPPYKKGLISKALAALQNWMENGCICVLESESIWEEALPEGFKITDTRTYGDTKITFAKKL